MDSHIIVYIMMAFCIIFYTASTKMVHKMMIIIISKHLWYISNTFENFYIPFDVVIHIWRHGKQKTMQEQNCLKLILNEKCLHCTQLDDIAVLCSSPDCRCKWFLSYFFSVSVLLPSDCDQSSERTWYSFLHAKLPSML